MPGAADDIHVRQPQALRRVAYRLDATQVEIQRRKIGGGGQLEAQAMLAAGRLDHPAHLFDHRIQAHRLEVAEVQGHAHLAGDHIARTGIGLQATDRAAGVGLMLQGHPVDRGDHRGGADQGVLAQVHRRRPGVRLDAPEVEVEPFLPEGAEHHADGLVLVLEDRPLLDMRLEIGAHRMPRHRTRPGIADGVQRLADRDALGVALGQGLFQAEFLGEHPGAHHAGGEARAFLVGPDHHLQRRLGLHAQVIQGAQHLQAGQHAEAAVEFAAGGLGVDMAAGHHRRQGGITSGTAGEDITHRVDSHRAAGLFAPAHEQVAGLAIQVAQGQTTDSALDGGTELGQFHQRLPQAFAVDVRVAGLQDVSGYVHGYLLNLSSVTRPLKLGASAESLRGHGPLLQVRAVIARGALPHTGALTTSGCAPRRLPRPK
ncbi:hypothetical protein D3C85_813530 [compost metagenome]